MRSLRFANRPNVGRTWLFVGLAAAATLALPGDRAGGNDPNRRARREQYGRLWVELGPSLARAVGGNVTGQRLRRECQRPGRHWPTPALEYCNGWVP